MARKAKAGIEALISFASRVLYIVVEKHFGIDKAYQEAYRRASRKEKEIPPPVLYRVARGVVDRYYTLRYIERMVYGSKTKYKRIARLWLYYYGLKDPGLVALTSLASFARQLSREKPGLPSSIEEVVEEIEEPIERLAVQYSYPKWFTAHMANLVGERRVAELLSALSKEQWWIRVNLLKTTDIESVMEKLYEKGVEVEKDNDLEYMLKVKSYRNPLHHLEEMWEGLIVFQDKASAMVVEALEPRENDIVLDLAAAPGIKASQIMMLTNNSAHIVAVDLSWERLSRMKKLLRLYGVDPSRVELVNADAATVDFKVEGRVKLLLDAPCTSSGAIGKDPAIKIHLGDEAWVKRFPYIQRLMLMNLVRFLKNRNGCTAVYATCSLLDFEGEEHIEALGLETMLEKPPIPGAPGYAKYSFNGLVSRFYPDIHETQGFFISRLGTC